MTRGHEPDRYDFLTVVALFACSTALYAVLGVRFDGSTLSSMAFIDQPLLAERLLESLWYFHATPPLLNLIVGIGIKAFGEHAAAFYTVFFHIVGFLAALCVYLLAWRLSASRVAAAVTTALLLFSPQFVLNENCLFYDFLATALLIFATYALYHFVQTRSVRWGVGFFALLAVLLLTRSVFHLAWMVVITALLLVFLWEWRRQILLAAAVPLLIVALWYGKNAYYFGKFGASTWMGLGLYNVTTMLVPQRELVPLVQRHELSTWALVSRYDPRGLIFRAQLRPPLGVPVVDNMTKADGRANWNYRDIPAIDRYYTADALTVARRFPATYVFGLYLSNRLYFSPTSFSPYWLPGNAAAVQPMERIFTPLLSGVSANVGLTSLAPYGFPDELTTRINPSPLLIAVWLAAFGSAYALARKAFIQRAARADPAGIVMGFLFVTAVYLYVISTTIELGENYRYRFLIEPLFFVLTAAVIMRGLRALRSVTPAKDRASWMSGNS